MSSSDEVVAEFLVAAVERLERLDADLRTLRATSDDPEAIASAFGVLQSLRATGGFLGFRTIEAVAREAENVLGAARDRGAGISPEITSALRTTREALDQCLKAIEETGTDARLDHRLLVDALTLLRRDPAHLGDGAQRPAEEPSRWSPTSARLGEILVRRGAATPEQVTIAAHEQDFGDRRRIGEILVATEGVDSDDIEGALQNQHGSRSLADASVRIDLAELDDLVRLVGELVVARDRVVQLAHVLGAAELSGAAQQLHDVTSALRDGVLQTRMQPIGNVWGRLPRIVRDLSMASGKQVRLELIGQDTMVDKAVLEVIKDPLTELVRHIVEHGIETVAARRLTGKPGEGRLTLRASGGSDQIVMQISDDGAGLVADRLVAGARPELGAEAGILTAAVERIGGVIAVGGEPGVGTSVTVRLPRTLVRLPALMPPEGFDHPDAPAPPPPAAPPDPASRTPWWRQVALRFGLSPR